MNITKKQFIIFGIVILLVGGGVGYATSKTSEEIMLKAVETRITTQTNNPWNVSTIVATGAARLPMINSTTTKSDDLTVNTQGIFSANARIATLNATTTKVDAFTANTSVLMSLATTTGRTVFASTAPGDAATSTVTFGSYGTADTKGLCLKFFTGGNTIWCYFSAATLTCSVSVNCE